MGPGSWFKINESSDMMRVTGLTLEERILLAEELEEDDRPSLERSSPATVQQKMVDQRNDILRLKAQERDIRSRVKNIYTLPLLDQVELAEEYTSVMSALALLELGHFREREEKIDLLDHTIDVEKRKKRVEINILNAANRRAVAEISEAIVAFKKSIGNPVQKYSWGTARSRYVSPELRAIIMRLQSLKRQLAALNQVTGKHRWKKSDGGGILHIVDDCVGEFTYVDSRLVRTSEDYPTHLRLNHVYCDTRRGKYDRDSVQKLVPFFIVSLYKETAEGYVRLPVRNRAHTTFLPEQSKFKDANTLVQTKKNRIKMLEKQRELQEKFEKLIVKRAEVLPRKKVLENNRDQYEQDISLIEALRVRLYGTEENKRDCDKARLAALRASKNKRDEEGVVDSNRDGTLQSTEEDWKRSLQNLNRGEQKLPILRGKLDRVYEELDTTGYLEIAENRIKAKEAELEKISKNIVRLTERLSHPFSEKDYKGYGFSLCLSESEFKDLISKQTVDSVHSLTHVPYAFLQKYHDIVYNERKRDLDEIYIDAKNGITRAIEEMKIDGPDDPSLPLFGGLLTLDGVPGDFEMIKDGFKVGDTFFDAAGTPFPVRGVSIGGVVIYTTFEGGSTDVSQKIIAAVIHSNTKFAVVSESSGNAAVFVYVFNGTGFTKKHIANVPPNTSMLQWCGDVLMVVVGDEIWRYGGNQRTILKGHNKPITCICAKGEHIATGSEDKTIMLWSNSPPVLKVGDRVVIFQRNKYKFGIAEKQISEDTFNVKLDNGKNAMCKCEPTAHLHTVAGHKDAVTDVVWGKRLVSSSLSKTACTVCVYNTKYRIVWTFDLRSLGIPIFKGLEVSLGLVGNEVLYFCGDILGKFNVINGKTIPFSRDALHLMNGRKVDDEDIVVTHRVPTPLFDPETGDYFVPTYSRVDEETYSGALDSIGEMEKAFLKTLLSAEDLISFEAETGKLEKQHNDGLSAQEYDNKMTELNKRFKNKVGQMKFKQAARELQLRVRNRMDTFLVEIGRIADTPPRDGQGGMTDDQYAEYYKEMTKRYNDSVELAARGGDDSSDEDDGGGASKN